MGWLWYRKLYVTLAYFFILTSLMIKADRWVSSLATYKQRCWKLHNGVYCFEPKDQKVCLAKKYYYTYYQQILSQIHEQI